MNYNRFIIKLLLSLKLVILSVLALNFMLDPLSFYRFPTLYEAQYSTNARFQLPGFIKNANYDTVIIGTSLSRNFIESHVDQTMGVQSLNASIPASTAKEQSLAARLAMHTGKVNQVIWELNYYSLAREPKDVDDGQNKFPYHLYDQNPINDVKYLLSLYPLETMYAIFRENIRRSTLNRDREMLYKFGFENKPLTLEQIPELITIENQVTQSNYKTTLMMENFNENVLSLVIQHPDIDFLFFHPPYPIFWYVRADRQIKGYIDEIVETKVKIYEELSKYPNVTLFDFQDREEITHVVNLYMDVAHFFPITNDWLLTAFMEEPPVQSLEEARMKADRLKDQVIHFHEERLVLRLE